ncbi:zinc-ribbon domain-containing protein [Arthrobacter sp. A5]|uniref:zinc-ribbon domain-containing protein n=1 Tax=Arthrobacter sp. A5 TaxID=576926 RepID=UPI003DA9360A
MFLLFGFKTVFHTLFSRPGTCQYCGQCARQDVEERATKLTVFFIPLLTTSRHYWLTCTNCARTTVLTTGQKNALMA